MRTFVPVKKELAMSPQGFKLSDPFFVTGLQAVATVVSLAPIF